MSGTSGRFRIKKGDIEVEFEGEHSEAIKRFNEALEWIRGTPTPPEPSKEVEEGGKKIAKKTGEIKAIVERVNILKDEGFFAEPRDLGAIKSQMQTRGWYHTSPNIQSALLRHQQKLGIKRVQEAGKYKYVKV